MISPKTTWIVLSALIALNVAGAALYGFMMYRISSEKTKAAEALSKLEAGIKKEYNLRALSAALEKTEEERAKIDSYFVDIKGVAKFLEKLQSFGDASGVSLKLENVDIEGKNALKVSFNDNGSFAENYRLLELIENSPYTLEIDSMNINKVMVSVPGGASVSLNNLWSGSFSVRLLSFVNK